MQGEDGKKRVAVIYGGTSCECEASIKNADEVIRVLQENGHSVYPLVYKKEIIHQLLKVKPDVVFICVQGKGHGDGTIQAICDFLNLKYTGSHTSAAAIINDKKICKQLCLYHHFETPPFFAMHKKEYQQLDKEKLKKQLDKIGYPIMVKGITQGGSFGIARLLNDNDLRLVDTIYTYDDEVLFEKFISGRFITVSLLANNDTLTPLTVLDVKTKRNTDLILCDQDSDFYAQNADLSQSLKEKIISTSLSLANIFDIKGYARLDYILDKHGVFHFLEVNAVPGLRKQSLFPLAAQLSNISIHEVIENVLQDALKQDV